MQPLQVIRTPVGQAGKNTKRGARLRGSSRSDLLHPGPECQDAPSDKAEFDRRLNLIIKLNKLSIPLPLADCGRVLIRLAACWAAPKPRGRCPSLHKPGCVDCG